MYLLTRVGLSNRTKDVLMENRGAIPRIEEATHGQESSGWTQGVAIFLKFHVPVSFQTADLKGSVHCSSVAIQTPRLALRMDQLKAVFKAQEELLGSQPLKQ
jgi:hypothetical protein